MTRASRLSRRGFARVLGARCARWFAGWSLLASATSGGPARALGVSVPISLQAQLLAKSAAYDRSLDGRAKPRLRVLLVRLKNDPESVRVAGEMRRELERIGKIATWPIDCTQGDYTNAPALARVIREQSIGIVYLAPGFDAEMPRIAQALSGVDVLSAGALASYVPKGAVLGFDLVSSKPQLLVHLAQARRQNVNFDPRLLRLAKVFE